MNELESESEGFAKRDCADADADSIPPHPCQPLHRPFPWRYGIHPPLRQVMAIPGVLIDAARWIPHLQTQGGRIGMTGTDSRSSACFVGRTAAILGTSVGTLALGLTPSGAIIFVVLQRHGAILP